MYRGRRIHRMPVRSTGQAAGSGAANPEGVSDTTDVAVNDDEHLRDAQLVGAARAGDKAALGILVSRHRSMVFALTRRLLGDEALAADAVGEATIAALVGLGRLRSPERFGAWYAGIALNVGRRLLRERFALVPMPDDLPDDQLGPEEHVAAAEMARRVRRALAVLAPGQREAVLAFYWQGLTHAEAAAELGINPGAVKARLHQARAASAPTLPPITRAKTTKTRSGR